MERPTGFDCPECGPDARLAPPAGPLRAHACPSCSGALLGPLDVRRLREIATPAPPARPLPDVLCPSCGEPVVRAVLADTPFAPCDACGAAWLGPGPLLRWAEARLASRAPPAPSPAPFAGARPSPSRRARVLVLAFAAAAVVASLSWIGSSFLRQAPSRPRQALSRASSSPPPAAAAPKPVTQPSAPALPSAVAGAPAAEERAPDVLLAPAVALGEVESFPAEPGRPRVLLAHRPGPAASLLVMFGAGAVDDADLPGLTRVAQHALLHANAAADGAEIALAVHTAGASLQMTTGQRDATFLLTADRRDFSRLAALLSKALLEPRFLPSRMPDVLARALLDDAARPGLLELVTALAAEDTRYLNPAVARKDDVESITAGDVARHLDGPLSPANATVVVTGAFDRDRILPLLRRARGGRASGSARVRLAVPFSARRASETELHLLAYPISVTGPREAACARLAAELLYDVLWRQFRETGVGYSHQVTAYRRRWVDLLALALPGRDSSTDLGPALREAVARVREGRFEDRDLDRARGAVRGALLAAESDPALLASTLGTGGLLWHGRELTAEIAALDRTTFLGVVRPWLDPASSVSLYTGPNP